MADRGLLHLSLVLAWGASTQGRHRALLDMLGRLAGVGLAVAVIGVLFGAMFKRMLADDGGYVWSLAHGLLVWALVAGIVAEAGAVPRRWEAVMRRSPMPLLAVLVAVPLRWAPVLGLGLVAVAVARWRLLGDAVQPLALLAAWALLVANGLWLAVLCGCACARFPRLSPLLRWGCLLVLVLSPVLWPDYFLGVYRSVLVFNPLHHLTLVAAAGTGSAAPQAWWVAALMAVAGGVAARLAHGRWGHGG